MKVKILFLLTCTVTSVLCGLKKDEAGDKLTRSVIGQRDKSIYRDYYESKDFEDNDHDDGDDDDDDDDDRSDAEFLEGRRRIRRSADHSLIEEKKRGNNGDSKNTTTAIDGICTSIDIRHSLDNLNNVQNCAVIEGSLQIVQIDFTNGNVLENFTFPNLREITGHLIIYRVNGIDSLANVFPNLQVIRGQRLFVKYALIVYEMPDLREIGIKKLVEISRGGIRVEKNPNLCYANTVNWNIIVNGGDIFVKHNKDDGSCPGCHPECSNGNCWSSKHCQRMATPTCHSECLGQCYGDGPSTCYVCKHYRHQDKCVAKCPDHLYGYLSRRCVTREECLTMELAGLQRKTIGVRDRPVWRPFNGTCGKKCPEGFEDFHDTSNGLTCKKCSGPCGDNVGNIDDDEFYDVNRNGNFPSEFVESLTLAEEVRSLYSASKRSRSVGDKNSRESTSKNVPTNPKSEDKKRGKNNNIKDVTVPNDGSICESTDIRNTVDNFYRLENCVIIEGFLQIVLIDKILDNAFENITFPKLREITGYLLLYRVSGLKSLTNIFPNLVVIRGQTLFTDYAFMVYEMPHLQELGLKKLVEISRGGVRIESNPALCYVNTVNWNPIVVGAGDIFIKRNADEKTCPGCHSSCNNGNCWTSKLCQKIIAPECHSECLGWCYGIEESSCYVCKHYRYEGKCVAECPKHLYGYLSTRCISETECYAMIQRSPTNVYLIERNFRPFNGSCINQCPIGYEDHIDSNNVTMCKQCSGPCRRVLSGETIRNMADAQRYRGMNVVQGGLEFHIENGNRNIMNELYDSFGAIEEITGYLKVMHSFPITSLAFFKNLKVIKGDPTDANGASLTIVDNPNLSNLFAKDQKIEIQKGRLYFHYNPKLCISKIEELGHMTGIKNFSKVEVDPESNGEKVACNIVNINIEIADNGPNYATIVWNNFVPPKGQRLLGYILNYIMTENKNITVFDSNFCGNNTWQSVDVDIPNSDDVSLTVSKTITGLKPYTSYAMYVKTYTSRNENIYSSPVGQSEINFFRTKSDIPSPPTNLSSLSVSDSEIIVYWSPPEQPNGPIAYYLISGYVRIHDRDLLETRDYCVYSLVDETVEQSTPEIDITEKIPAIDIIEKIPAKDDPKSCCKKDSKEEVKPVKPTLPKDFQIMCHENMSIGMYVSGEKSYCEISKINYLKPAVSHGTYETFFFNVSARNNSYLVQNLTHYATYTMSISACGEKISNDVEHCSDIRYTTAQTARKEDADDIRNLDARLSNDTIVTVTWDPIESPNGLTVTYTIEYTNLDVKDAKTISHCVTEKDIREDQNRYDITNLSPGKYNIRVRSTSLAGDGRFSDINFVVPVRENNSIEVVIGLCFAFVIVAIMSISCFVYRRRQNKIKQIRLIASVNPDYIETQYVRDDWEVSRADVQILEELGLGNFGMVYHGILHGTKHVAIKTISETTAFRDRNEFLNEASVMKNFTTFHIIKLLGVVSVDDPPLVIMELMENGDLKTYLRKIRDTNLVPNFSRICRMAAEIADGMAYLESRKFVHRDLAARNCMVSKDLVCKIGDFGMARDIYETDYYKIGKKGLLPIRWMAPENLSDGVFTSDSDVWSYGIVLYEILSLAEIPYQGFSNEEVLNYVLRKGTVDIPKNCPEIIYKIIEKCFKWRPSDRPTFLEIVSELEPFLSQDFCTASFYHSSEGVTIRNSGIKKVYHNAAPIRFYFGNETARWVKDFEDNVMLLDQTKAGSSRGRIFKNGFQQFGKDSAMEDVSLDR